MLDPDQNPDPEPEPECMTDYGFDPGSGSATAKTFRFLLFRFRFRFNNAASDTLIHAHSPQTHTQIKRNISHDRSEGDKIKFERHLVVFLIIHLHLLLFFMHMH